MSNLFLQVTPNLYGTLVANTAAGIAGGTGVMPGGSELFYSTSPYLNSGQMETLFGLFPSLCISS